MTNPMDPYEQLKWDKYAIRLKALAKAYFYQANPSVGGDTDLVSSTIAVYFEKHVNGQLPIPESDEHLWDLLATYLFRKGAARKKKEPHYKAAVRLPRNEEDPVNKVWNDYASREPDENIAEKFIAEVGQMPDWFDDPLTKRIAMQLLKGKSIITIAETVGSTAPRVRRRRTKILNQLNERIEALEAEL